MNVDALLVGDLAGGGRTDQVVRQSEHSARFDTDPAHHKLACRLLSPVRHPAVELGCVCERERSRGDP